MHNGVDNRLTSAFILDVLMEALNIVERDWRRGTTENGAPGALIISGKQDQAKFFSNGQCIAAKHTSFPSRPLTSLLNRTTYIGLDYETLKDDPIFWPGRFSRPQQYFTKPEQYHRHL